MSRRRQNEPAIPAWMDDLANHSLIGSKEMTQITGYANLARFNEALGRGMVIAPCRKWKGFRGTTRNYWSMGDVRAWAKAGFPKPSEGA